MVCKKCGCENAENARFCAKCGGAMSAKKRGRAWLIAGIAALAAVLVVGGVLLSVNMLKSPYDEQIELGYQLIDDGKYEEAVLAFDRAIEIDKKKPRGYVGKASAMAEMDAPDVDAIEQVLILGYEESESDEVLDAFDEIAEKLTDRIAEEKVESFVAAKDKIGAPILDIENDKFGYIDADGNTVIEHRYDYACDFKGELAKVYIENKYGFVDKNGNEIVPCKYDYADDFSDGLAAVRKDEKWYYIDETGNVVISCEYNYVYPFEGKVARVYKGMEHFDALYGLIDRDGNEVVPCSYTYISEFSEGYAYAADKDGKYGYIDVNGNEITALEYDQVSDFSEGLAAVRVGDWENGKWGYIDKDGNQVIPCKYDDVSDFSEGLAAVRVGDWKNGKWGYIDKSGKEIIPLKYNNASDFYKDRAPVMIGSASSRRPQYGVIDTSGSEIVPLYTYDYISDFSEGLAACSLDEKYGFIDVDGNAVIPFKYDGAEDFIGDYAIVYYGDYENRKCGIIDREGNEIVPCIYDVIENSEYKKKLYEAEGWLASGSEILFEVKMGDFYTPDKTKYIVINPKGVRESEWQ